ncbi:MAG: DUF3352 domain-containing protein [Leptolyngbya sp. SIOISBB]|nr:DUF3352 domain-containing protein [Leptolyngbya sp. SIOISBB]
MFAKKPPLFVTIGTTCLLLAVGTLTYAGLRWRTLQARGLPAGVKAVPQTAVAAVTLSTNPEQWQQVRQFGTVETQTAFDQQLAQWRDRWLDQYDVSFTEDIAPWVGPEVTVAWVPQSEAVSEAEPGTVVFDGQRRLLLLPIADPEAAQISAETLPLSTTNGNSIEYRGVTLTQVTATDAEATDSVFIGLLGTRLILVAEDETVAQQAIDAYKGGNNLADVAGYRRSFEHIGVSQAFSKLYVNIPAATQLLAQTSQPALPAALVESFQESRGLAATIALETQGLQVRSTSWFGEDSDRTYVDTNVPAQLPEYVPRDTLVFASGGSFQQFWQDLSGRRNWGALTALNPDNLSLALQGSTGLTLEEDLMPWMQGEFALALVPPAAATGTEDATPLPNPSLVALVQVSNRPEAEQAFAQLDEVVANRYRFTISNEPEGEIELVRWTSPFESTMLSRGWLDSSIAFLTLGAGTDEAIVPKPRRSLAKSPLFQLTTGDAPYPNNGYFFVNVKALTQAEGSLFIPDLPAENQNVLDAIEALGVTSTVLDEQRLRYDLYLVLNRGNRPGPLPNSQTQDDMSAEDTPADAAPAEETSPDDSSSAEQSPAEGTELEERSDET